jgi:DNA-binding transcriptional MerR regulator
MLHSIGELARRTGLTVKAIRFYSDQGIVPCSSRSPAGYRRYDLDAVARLDLVRTLRSLGLDLATVRKVVDREVSLASVAATHAEALGAEIRLLRLRRAVLSVVARQGSTPEEMDLMHKLAKLSEDERQRLVASFLDATIGADFPGIRNSLTPSLPEDPTAEQVEAWVELATLAGDPTFRSWLRELAASYSNDAGSAVPPRRDVVAAVRDRVRPLLRIDPASDEASPLVASLTAHYAALTGGGHEQLLARLEGANDPRWERYLELLSVINGWPAPDGVGAELNWMILALRTRIPA